MPYHRIHAIVSPFNNPHYIPLLHHCRGLLGILNSESQKELEELAVDFTTSHSHFDSVVTVELEQGGEGKMVTMENKAEFVNKMCTWHLQGTYC